MKEIEENALSTTTRKSMELAPTQAMAEAQFDIQSAIVIARKFPRDEVAAEKKMLKAATRPVFADDAIYSYPRGWKYIDGRRIRNYVEGPSIVLAREAARSWTNIRFGLEVIVDDEEDRTIRAYAYDMETNVKVTMEDSFKKLVQRKIYEDGKDTGQTRWEVADERELRELTNRRGAIAVRNCILQLIPTDIVDNVRNACEVTLRQQAAEHKDETISKVIKAFSAINVSVKMIEKKLGHKLEESTPEELTDLRKIYSSIKDGNSSWSEYTEVKKSEESKDEGSLSMSDLSAPEKTESDKKTETDKKTSSKKKSSKSEDKPKDPEKKETTTDEEGVFTNPNFSEEEDPMTQEELDAMGTDNLFE